MQTIIPINIPGPKAEAVKEQIKAEARRHSMSVSRYLLWCWTVAKSKPGQLIPTVSK